MVTDGQLIARDLRNALRERARKVDRQLKLGVIVTESTPEIEKFVSLKQRFGQEVGVQVDVVRLPALERTSEHLLMLIMHSTKDHDGLVLQLPLPQGLDVNSVLNIFPLSHDVDVIGNIAFEQHREGTLPFLPPVVGAFAEVLHREGVRISGTKVTVVGEGRLVGAPAALWAAHLGATVTTVNKLTTDIAAKTLGADIIILGAGSPALLKPDMVHDGVIILDAGTSEQNGVLVGDADPACAAKARIFTPTPGGIGPITVAKVFENLFALYELKARRDSK